MVDYPLVVTAAFAIEHSEDEDLSSMQRLNFRHDAAKALISSEYSHCVGDLEKKAKAEHDAKINEWNLTLDNIPLANDVDQYVSLFLFLGLTDSNFISIGLETLSSMLCTPFCRRSALTLAATLLSLPEMARRMTPMKGFLLRETFPFS